MLSHDALTAAGFTHYHTGGGVYAWRKFVDNFEVMICAADEDGGLGDDDTQQWGMSIWTAEEGEIVCETFDFVSSAIAGATAYLDNLFIELLGN
jgi:hypothetical protein